MFWRNCSRITKLKSCVNIHLNTEKQRETTNYFNLWQGRKPVLHNRHGYTFLSLEKFCRRAYKKQKKKSIRIAHESRKVWVVLTLSLGLCQSAIKFLITYFHCCYTSSTSLGPYEERSMQCYVLGVSEILMRPGPNSTIPANVSSVLWYFFAVLIMMLVP